MKKTVILIAAAAMLCACTKENPKAPVTQAEGYGYISVGVDTDETTKADNVTTVTDLSTWTATVTKSDSSDASYTGSADGVGNTKFAAGTYTVEVSNYASLDAANSANSPWGAAYYTGSNTNVSVTAGQTTPATVSCGKAKNARFSVNFEESFTTVVKNDYTVTLSGPKNLTFNKDNKYTTDTNVKWAYFEASTTGEGAVTTTVSYTLTYTLNKGGDPISKTGTIDLGTAGTQKVFNVRANSNGQINLTISYEDFTSAGDTNLEIDATTGDEVTSQK